MTTISVDKPVVTIVNVFTVEQENQQPLIDLLVEATKRTMRHLPGFVSANIHKSLDGKHVTNYAQWRREEDFRAMLTNPEAQLHMKGALALATLEGYLYRVAYCDGGQDE
jgi:heme-degrading monooxygenase HmoA